MNDVDRRLEIPRRMIGRPRDAPVTPALILDLPTVRKNIAEMARRMDGVHADLRPHAKIHKSPILGRMQLDAGGIGLTTATIWEASVMLEAGCRSSWSQTRSWDRSRRRRPRVRRASAN